MAALVPEEIKLTNQQNEIADRNSFKKGIRRFATFEIEGLDAPVRIRSLTSSEFAKVEAIETQAIASVARGKRVDRSKLQDAKYTLLQLCIVDNNGEPLFKSQDREVLKSLDSRIVSALEKVCTDHCGDQS